MVQERLRALGTAPAGDVDLRGDTHHRDIHRNECSSLLDIIGFSDRMVPGIRMEARDETGRFLQSNDVAGFSQCHGAHLLTESLAKLTR